MLVKREIEFALVKTFFGCTPVEFAACVDVILHFPL
jgi:hypothetical protein